MLNYFKKPVDKADAKLTLSKATLDAIQLKEKTIEQAITAGETEDRGQEGSVHGVPRTAGHLSVLVQHRHAVRSKAEVERQKDE